MALIEVGSKAPAFTLRDQRGRLHALGDYAGRTLVLYFYPKDDTTGCTAEACQFRDHQPDFSKIKAAVLGVSPDPEDSHRSFADKHGLNFPLLADLPDADGNPPVCRAYGVWQEKSMYGRKYMGVARTTYLIGADGVVKRRWDSVKVPGHSGEVLDAVKALHSGQSLLTVELKPRKVAKDRPAKKTRASVKKAAGKREAKKGSTAASRKAKVGTRGKAKPVKRGRKAIR